MKKQGFNIVVHCIGFAVSAEAREQLTPKSHGDILVPSLSASLAKYRVTNISDTGEITGLKAITAVSGGQYYSADNADQLTTYSKEVTQRSVEAYNAAGEKVEPAALIAAAPFSVTAEAESADNEEMYHFSTCLKKCIRLGNGRRTRGSYLS